MTIERKRHRLPQEKLDSAREAIGTRIETEMTERALDLVVLGDRLVSGTEGARGRGWHDVFGEMESVRRG